MWRNYSKSYNKTEYQTSSLEATCWLFSAVIRLSPLFYSSLQFLVINVQYRKEKGAIMKRAVNLRLEESVIVTLNQLTQELDTTKTEVIERAIGFFSKQNSLKHHELLQFAGKLKSNDADNMLQAITDDKNSKNFELDL